MGFLNFEGLQHFFSRLPEKFAELRHAHHKDDIVGLEEAVVTDDSNGNVSIDFLTGEGAVAGASAGTVLYDVDPANGICCNGTTTTASRNSVALYDPEKKYKRLKIYARFPYATHVSEFSLGETSQSSDEVFGNKIGGLMVPANDCEDGRNKHILYIFNFAVYETASGWTFHATDAGWLSLGIPTTSASQLAAKDTTVPGTSYLTWNQRHNGSYCIYKIIGYED